MSPDEQFLAFTALAIRSSTAQFRTEYEERDKWFTDRGINRSGVRLKARMQVVSSVGAQLVERLSEKARSLEPASKGIEQSRAKVAVFLKECRNTVLALVAGVAKGQDHWQSIYNLCLDKMATIEAEIIAGFDLLAIEMHSRHVESAMPIATIEPEKRKSGRRPGNGSFEVFDAPLVERMRKMIEAGEVVSVNQAAYKVAHLAHGTAGLQSKADRLRKLHRKMELNRSA